MIQVPGPSYNSQFNFIWPENPGFRNVLAVLGAKAGASRRAAFTSYTVLLGNRVQNVGKGATADIG